MLVYLFSTTMLNGRTNKHMKKRHNPIPDCLVHGIKGCPECSKKLGRTKPLKTAEQRKQEKFQKMEQNEKARSAAWNKTMNEALRFVVDIKNTTYNLKCTKCQTPLKKMESSMYWCKKCDQSILV